MNEVEYKEYRNRKNNEYKKRMIKKSLESDNHCLFCGKPIPESHKYCSVQCQNNLRHKQTMEHIEECNGIGCDIRRIKTYLIETKGHRCELCGNTEWLGQPIPLIIDHINGRASDNRLENLRLVCGNCDMQLPTYKSKNKNSDRKRVGKWI